MFHTLRKIFPWSLYIPFGAMNRYIVITSELVPNRNTKHISLVIHPSYRFKGFIGKWKTHFLTIVVFSSFWKTGAKLAIRHVHLNLDRTHPISRISYSSHLINHYEAKDSKEFNVWVKGLKVRQGLDMSTRQSAYTDL